MAAWAGARRRAPGAWGGPDGAAWGGPAGAGPASAPRVLVLGDSGAGKSCLVRWLARGGGRPSAGARLPTSTVGFRVTPLSFPGGWVELVEVGGHALPGAPRGALYRRVAGVLLVRARGEPRPAAALRRWAHEVAAHGDFDRGGFQGARSGLKAGNEDGEACPIEQAFCGRAWGLHQVPVLCVGTASDSGPGERAWASGLARWAVRCAAWLAARAGRGELRRALERRLPTAAALLPRTETSVHGEVAVDALRGTGDLTAFHAFFAAVAGGPHTPH